MLNFQQHFPEEKTRFGFLAPSLSNQRENAPTYENLVADDVLQLELPRDVLQRDAVVGLQEPCRQGTHRDLQGLPEQKVGSRSNAYRSGEPAAGSSGPLCPAADL